MQEYLKQWILLVCGLGAFRNGTEGHGVLGVVLGTELCEKTSLGRYMVQSPKRLTRSSYFAKQH